MIEYLYDAIRAVHSQEIEVNAVITDPLGDYITEDCTFVLHDDNHVLFTIDGEYKPELSTWAFIIPKEKTLDLKGRYFYCIRHKDENMCFMQPFYLV